MERLSIGTTGWMGLQPREFARRFDVVEFNWTFHERDESPEKFERVAKELADLRLQAFVKVSGLATHEHRLRAPEDWWPGLWAKYAVLHRAGVLRGLLWQLAPSHHCTPKTLDELDKLARRLPLDVLSVFEFRHSSWYNEPLAVETLRRHRLCLVWIHIANEDGWCGDLDSGWPTRTRTCDAVYLRLFGTKRKAIGRYPDAFLQDEILPYVRGPTSAAEAFVVFAQADVPDHATADASALVELLGRTRPIVARSTRWERDVLAATLGLEVGATVDGCVQRISHRTVLVDIGRACRATVCAHHARRVGLLESLRVGTILQGLVVENLEFSGEWGIVGLTCHDAEIETLGGPVETTTLRDVTGLAVTAPSPEADEEEWLVGVEGPVKNRWKRVAAAGSETCENRAAPPDPGRESLQDGSRSSAFQVKRRWGRQPEELTMSPNVVNSLSSAGLGGADQKEEVEEILTREDEDQLQIKVKQGRNKIGTEGRLDRRSAE